MPTYQYRCTTCDEVFDVVKPMSEASWSSPCAQGHEAKRVLSVFASVGASSGSASREAPAPAPSAGFGGCGGGCACH